MPLLRSIISKSLEKGMKDNQKVLGVIGGMGPLATQLFYKMVIEHTDAHCDQEHLNMVILNHATMPDREIYSEREA